jgi:hypothetical protein
MSRLTASSESSGEILTAPVRSSPPEICTANFIGPSCRQICDVPVTRDVNTMRSPFEVIRPVPAPRTSSIAWMCAVTFGSSGGARYFAISVADTLSAPSPL